MGNRIILWWALLFAGHAGGADDNAWQSVISDDWVSISVERALYRKPDSSDGFIHVVVSNRTNQKIAAELSNPGRTIHPNEWEGHTEKARGGINERRFGVEPMDDAAQKRFKEACRLGSIPLAAPHGKLDYYINFGGHTKKDLEMPGNYLLVVVDGELAFTNGNALHFVQLLTEESLQHYGPKREVWMSLPIRWKLIPDGATVVKQ